VSEIDYKELFITYTNWLHEEKGIAYKKIAEKAGIKSNRMRQLRSAKTAVGRLEDIEKLLTAYPELKTKSRDKESVSREELEDLRREVEDRISRIEKMMLAFSLKQQQEMSVELVKELREIEKKIDKKKAK